MNWDSDSSCLVCNRTCDCLSYPPCSVGRELVSLCIIKLFNCLDKSEITLLDKIEELHTSADISFCDAYNKSQVCFAQTLSCILVALCHTGSKLNFFFRCQQRHSAYLLEIDFNRVVYSDAFR